MILIADEEDRALLQEALRLHIERCSEGGKYRPAFMTRLRRMELVLKEMAPCKI